VIAVMLTRPIKSFKSMAGLDTRHSIFRGLLKRGTSALLGFSVGKQAAEDADSAAPKSVTHVIASRTAVHRHDPSFDALPPPHAAPALGASADDRVPAWSPRELDAGPRTTGWSGATAFAMGHRSRAALTGGPRPATPESRGSVPGASLVDGGGGVVGSRERLGTSALRTPNGQADGSVVDVVYPTGVLVQRSPQPSRDSGLYRPGASNEEYVRLPEAQLDAEGREASGVTYRSGRSARAHAAAT
jgi:hypothetical protein